MRVLITGITGFVGSHLAELYLNYTDYEVYGTKRWRSRMDNIEHIKDKITLIECDVTDPKAVQDAVNECEPKYIHHLAAQSYVPTSWRCPEMTINTNVIGTLNILEAVRSSNAFDTVIQIAGSSEEYGMVLPDETPIKETNPLRPLSPYGVSKVACDLLSMQYFHSYGVQTVVTRAFNHTGPRRGEVFVCSDFAKQIAEIEKGKKDAVIHHGNLGAVRDFTDVRDIVKAYFIAVREKKCVGEQLNICSEIGYEIDNVISILNSLSERAIKFELDPARSRPSDVPILLGDCTKFKDLTGWYPTIKFEKTLKDLLNYWRNKV
jgi:GDP-4-dehydro-6-deoxy-D-mannose reductase